MDQDNYDATRINKRRSSLDKLASALHSLGLFSKHKVAYSNNEDTTTQLQRNDIEPPRKKSDALVSARTSSTDSNSTNVYESKTKGIRYQPTFTKVDKLTARPPVTSLKKEVYTEDTSREKPTTRRRWTREEDTRLRAAVKTHDARNWKAISEEVGNNRSHIQCLQRWKQVLQPGLKKGNWSKEEDNKLRVVMSSMHNATAQGDKEAAAKFTDWKTVEKYMENSEVCRTAKQCRERWLLSLSPKINKADWTAAEDELLLLLQSRYGNSWAKIKKKLSTNRTENAVKLRFHYLNKQRNKLWSIEEDYLIIYGKKYKNYKYDVITNELNRNNKETLRTHEDKIKGRTSHRSKHAVQRRWKYLCSIDSELNAMLNDNGVSRINPTEQHGTLSDLALKKRAKEDAERVFKVAARILPEKLKGRAVEEPGSSLGGDITYYDDESRSTDINQAESAASRHVTAELRGNSNTAVTNNDMHNFYNYTEWPYREQGDSGQDENRGYGSEVIPITSLYRVPGYNNNATISNTNSGKVGYLKSDTLSSEDMAFDEVLKVLSMARTNSLRSIQSMQALQ